MLSSTKFNIASSVLNFPDGNDRVEGIVSDIVSSGNSARKACRCTGIFAVKILKGNNASTEPSKTPTSRFMLP